MDQASAGVSRTSHNPAGAEANEPMLASNRIGVVGGKPRRNNNNERKSFLYNFRTSGTRLDMTGNGVQDSPIGTADKDCFPMSLIVSGKRNRSPKDHKRLVAKSGESNIGNDGGSNSSNGLKGKTVVGLFTMLVDAKWRWTWLVFFASFYFTWMVFAIIFWFICFVHGDFDPTNVAEAGETNTNGTFVACIENIKDFTSIFLFSLEIQTTIGFGFSRVTEQCFPAIFTLTVQAILGAIIEAFLVGVVFTKLVRTKQRVQAITFSYCAVICQQDGQMCFMFRCADRHTSRIIGAKLRATLVRRSRTTREGHAVTLDQQPMNVHPSGEDSDLLLFWPATIVHPITVESPLYGITATQLAQDDVSFEIIVTLEGTTASTNMAAQAVTSYLPSEILWGYRFDDMIATTNASSRPSVDHSLLDSVYPVPETPLVSVLSTSLDYINN